MVNSETEVEIQSLLAELFVRPSGQEDLIDLALPRHTWPAQPEVEEALARAACCGGHGYTPIAGIPEARHQMALSVQKGTTVPIQAKQVLICAGASAGLNVVFRALFRAGDEVIGFRPYFPDFPAYVSNSGARFVPADVDANFLPSVEGLHRVWTSATRAVLLNSPNNPTGIVYPQRLFDEIGEFLGQQERATEKDVFLIVDETYRRMIFEGPDNPDIFRTHPRTVVVSSLSKDLQLAGHRIGYVAIHPSLAADGRVMKALLVAQRVLGFMNAPVISQRALGDWLAVRPPLERYRAPRALLQEGLTRAGLPFVPATGGVFLFARCPSSDVDFVRNAMRMGLLVMPGAVFGWPGCVRLTFAVPETVIHAAVPLLHSLGKGRVHALVKRDRSTSRAAPARPPITSGVVPATLKEGWLALRRDELPVSVDVEVSLASLMLVWDELEVDAYLPGGGTYRRRCYVRYLSDRNTGALRPIKSEYYYQSPAVNRAAGGISRVFPTLDLCLSNAPYLLETIRRVIRLLPSAQSWVVDAHLVRVEATLGSAGHPTPEGVHRDGFDFVSFHMVRRVGVRGGTTMIFNDSCQLLAEITLEEPHEMVLMDDRRLMHYTTPVENTGSGIGFRDMLLLSFMRVTTADP